MLTPVLLMHLKIALKQIAMRKQMPSSEMR